MSLVVIIESFYLEGINIFTLILNPSKKKYEKGFYTSYVVVRNNYATGIGSKQAGKNQRSG
jgi:hypothetical protein